MSDLISRQAAIDAVQKHREGVLGSYKYDEGVAFVYAAAHNHIIDVIKQLPSVQPERDTPKRVSWTGWKGHRDTRYKCPNCKKPVRNDDAYCHRCGQRLMFPHISFTKYIPGEKQETIVRWDDERPDK